MKSLYIKNKCTVEKEYPYFVEASTCSTDIWLVTGKPRSGSGFHADDRNAIYVSGNQNYKPFEYVGTVRVGSHYKKVERCRINFLIGDK